MNTKDLEVNTFEPSSSADIFLIDKGTQTSKVFNNDLMSSDNTPPKPLPKNIDTSCKDDDIKVFEFCEIIKDPEDDSVSIVKETFTEETITSSEGSFFERPTHNRYIYRREVIQPYCKAFSKACPKYPTSNDKVFKTPSKVSQNLPDHQPKVENNTENKNPSDKVCDKDSISIMDPKEEKLDPNESKITFENPTPSEVTKNENKRPCPPPRSTKKECQQQTSNCDEPKSKCPKFIDEAKLKDYLSSCYSTTVTMAKKGSAACLETCEKVIGIRQPKCNEEKPTYYVLKKPKSDTNLVKEKRSFEDILDSETVKNIKNTVQDLMGTIYTKTKDTVNVIKTESRKHLGLDKKSKTKVCENKSLDKITSILSDTFKRREQSAGRVSETSSLEKIVEPALAAIGKVTSAVSSTACAVKDHLLLSDETLDSKFDRSSPHDDPNIVRTSPPKEISHEHEPSENSSMFTMLKTKFFSMFADRQESCQDDENDDDDEEIGEKLFDKYCDQS